MDGRRVYTRADLMDAYGIGRSTLEKWFREREANGHPEPVGTVAGGRLVWDAQEWDRWYESRRSVPGVPPGLATRDELAAAHGLSRHMMKKLWAEREANGHPAPARRVGKALYWDKAEWSAWYATYRADRRERQERGGRDGDPDDLVTLADAARLLGLAQTSVTVYPRRPPAGWPEPVRTERLGGGRVRRLYRRGDILAYGRRRGLTPGSSG